MKRVLLTTGGTGGHIFPALAVAEELRRQFDGIELLFMGSQNGLEKRLAEKAGINYIGLPVHGVLGKGFGAVSALARLGMALPKALRIVREFSPDCAAGFGSYAAFAPLLAARLLRVPSILHEQNAVAGASNRVLAKFCDRICTSLPDTTGFDERHIVQTGNPVRKAIMQVGTRPRDFLGKHLLVMGGSQGAHAINMYICDLLPRLKELGIEICHQTGNGDEEAVKAAYAEAGMENCRVAAFFDNMAQIYSWADLAVCRAGASTVTELCAAALPSILVPFPYAIHDHQTYNALAMEKAGAAKVFAQKDVTSDVLGDQIRNIMGSKDVLKAMASSALCLASPEAASNVVRQMQEAVATRNSRNKKLKA